jgi:ankyrin repeat protein
MIKLPLKATQHMQHGLTALHKAAVTGQLACLHTLLDYNASVEKLTPDGLSAVHLAAWKGQHEVIRLLATRRADLNARSQDGGTPLHEAVRSSDNVTVHLLLQLGAKADVADKVRLCDWAEMWSHTIAPLGPPFRNVSSCAARAHS